MAQKIYEVKLKLHRDDPTQANYRTFSILAENAEWAVIGAKKYAVTTHDDITETELTEVHHVGYVDFVMEN